MATDTPNSAARLALLGAIDASFDTHAHEVEGEVVALFDELRDGLLRYVVSLGIGVHDGEDVIQEVFLSLFRHLRQGRSRQNLRGWVFRVAHNLALKQRTRVQRRESKVTAYDPSTKHQPDPAANPEEQLAWSQQHGQLLRVVSALPEQEQLCLRLRAEGLRYREIADVLDISLGSVSNSIARSMERLMRADGR